ncbi:U4/U6 small nuclear ribonucleoprotein Prp31-like [Zophobas morio]|jgi:U4/U6 small nuclear ribonucleoprotein PRP31|uniref:U4/U6 small nuclear ribonucleoprotein Prp31-like n=1 Tax=Zophobas morio TaxID=2755281 RepID=UPI003082C73C
MSLADELVADFEELCEEDEEINNTVEGDEWGLEGFALEGSGLEGSERAYDLNSSPRVIAKLLESKNLNDILNSISHAIPTQRIPSVTGVIEEDPEYQLIVKASAITVEIANEVNTLHKYIRDLYTERFSELEKIVLEPMAYIRSVYNIGNDLDINKADLNEILPAHIIMIVSVSATTSQGQNLDDYKLANIREACEMAFALEDAVKMITEFVESRMAFIAPNLSAICGPSTAAKLMGQAGGIAALAKMPACNLLVLGAQKKALTGFSNITSLPHCGFIYFSELVDPLPAEYKRKASRLVANKCSLASRLDAGHEYCDGSAGREFRAILEKKIEKMMEPPPARLEKPLPAPDEVAKKRRGGRRVRKMKKRILANEVDKAMNRLKFGEIQDDLLQTKIGYDVGMLGRGGTGRIRTAQIDNKVRTTITKRMQRELARQKALGGFQTSHSVKSSISTSLGTSSSVVYSADMGLEIYNPAAAEKVTEVEGKYFSATSNFKKISKAPE